MPDSQRQKKKAEDPDHPEFTIYLPEGQRVPGVSDSIANAQGLTYGKCSISNVFVEKKIMEEQMGAKIYTNKVKSN